MIGERIASLTGDSLALFAIKAFAIPGIESVRMRTYATFHDSTLIGDPGGSVHGQAVTLEITRATAGSINPETFHARDLYRAMGSWEAHPALRHWVLSFVRGP